MVALFSPPDEACESEALRMGATSVLNYPGPAEEIRAAVAGALFLNRPKRSKSATESDPSSIESAPLTEEAAEIRPLKEELDAHERDLIDNALRTLGWNRGETAKALGIERTTLFLKPAKYGLLEPNDPPSVP